MGGMKLWKRIMFSVVSIIWGFASLDYLYYAFRLMTGKTRSDGSYDLPRDGCGSACRGGVVFIMVFGCLDVFPADPAQYSADQHDRRKSNNRQAACST